MIEVQGLSKAFGTESVLNDLSFNLEQGQTLGVLGKSGCGKSTLLKILAGLEDADTGRFLVDGVSMLGLPPQKRSVVYLSQEPLLFPHLSVADNLAFGLKIRQQPSSDIRKKVTRLAEQLGLEDQLDKAPHQLSGGQKQRVNFGRSLIIDPDILLLDEPFGSLDAHTRQEMQQLFKSICQARSLTALFVTHDLKEALLMGDQIAIMDAGQLKVYASKAVFVAAPESGVRDEMRFWAGLG